jgi:lipopolysaccharide export system protein LptA
MSRHRTRLLVAVVAFSALAVQAQQPPLPPAKVTLPPDLANGKQKPKEAKEPKFANLHWQNWKHDDKTKISTGTNFRYESEDMTVTGDSARYNTDTKFLQATGNLVMENDKYHITGGKADIDDSKKKTAIITENVIIVLKPKKKEDPSPSAASAKEKEGSAASVSDERGRGVTITCDKVESQYKKKFVKMFGNVVFKQKVQKKDNMEVERILFSEHAEYDDKAERLHLFKPVHGQDTDGQKVEFETDVFVGTKEGEETLETPGKMTLRILQTEEDEENGDEKAKPKEAKPSDGKPQEPQPKEDKKPAAPAKPPTNPPPANPPPANPPPARKR